MKLLILLLLTYTCHAQEADMLQILDSIDRYPALYAVTYSVQDTSPHKLSDQAHKFSGFVRQGNDSTGRQAVKLYNGIYRCKYTVVIDEQSMADGYDFMRIPPDSIAGITVMRDRPGHYMSHRYNGGEYMVIIKTKKQK